MTDDDRVTCIACQWLRGGRCQQAKAAGLSQWASIEIGRDFIELLKRCPAFKERK